jgi:hypothetical protein
MRGFYTSLVVSGKVKQNKTQFTFCKRSRYFPERSTAMKEDRGHLDGESSLYKGLDIGKGNLTKITRI